jgi:hypothetical protein
MTKNQDANSKDNDLRILKFQCLCHSVYRCCNLTTIVKPPFNLSMNLKVKLRKVLNGGYLTQRLLT